MITAPVILFSFFEFRHFVGEADVGMIEQIVAAMAVAQRRAGHPFGQRGIDKDIDRPQPLRLKQGDEVFKHHLRPLDRKGGDQQIAAALQHLFNVNRELLAAVADQHRFAIAVAIGGFAEDMVIAAKLGIGAVDSGRHCRYRQRSGCAGPPSISSTEARTDDMPRIPQAKAVAIAQIVPVAIARFAQQADAFRDIFGGVKRLEGFSPARSGRRLRRSAVGGLQLGRIEQQRLDDVGGRLGRPDRRVAAASDQIGQSPAVIDMGMA